MKWIALALMTAVSFPARAAPHDDFFSRLTALCGERFVGQASFPEVSFN